jgi:hypothetical protein
MTNVGSLWFSLGAHKQKKTMTSAHLSSSFLDHAQEQKKKKGR